MEHQRSRSPHLEGSEDFELVHSDSAKGLKLKTKFKNLLSQLSANEEMQIVMVGLKAAGKTTMLEKINPSEVIITKYDDGAEIVRYKSINFTVWDVGVQAKNQPVWGYDTQGLIFVVDSNDRDRVVEAKNELHRILNEYEFREAVLLVFANKKDLPNPMDAAEITDNLSLHSLGQRHLCIQPTCAISEEGLYEGLDWLINNVANKSSTNSSVAVQTR